MIIPFAILFVFSSIIWLVIGIQNRNDISLFLLNVYWWLVSFVSAYFTLLVWQERGYSENWAMIGFSFGSLPYMVITGTLIIAELFFIRKWESNKTKKIKLTSVSLLIFFLIQMLVGFLST